MSLLSPLPCVADPRHDAALSLSSLRRIDRACERFEQALQRQQPHSIETELQGLPETERGALLRELLALELEYRQRRGDTPTRDEYAQRFADEEPLLSLVFAEMHDSTALFEGNEVPDFLSDHPRYRVLRLLGRGGMGSVYLAEHRSLERHVALKIIKPELLCEAAVVERFHREAKAAARLKHPNVVTVYDAESVVGGHFLIMEYIAGIDLARAVLRSGPLDVALACDYIRQAALGLQHAHEQGMVHRDITPRNLMLADDGRVTVLDFGLAFFAGEPQEVLHPSGGAVLLGSIDFMAPEQAAAPQAADIRADIYSLGCTLYFLLTGRPPFAGGTLAEKIAAHRAEEPPRLAVVRRDVPPQLAAAVARMLAKDPAARFQSPAEAAAALVPFSAGSEGTDSTNMAGGKRTWRRRWGLLTLSALMLAAVLYGAAAAALHFGAPDLDRVESSMSTQQAAAVRLYREGLHLMAQRREGQLQLAITRLEASLALDPNVAKTYSALADAYNISGDYGWQAPDEAFPKARAAARRAISLDPRLAEAHLALAFVLHEFDCERRRAESEYRKALELNPRLAAAHHWYAWFLVDEGRDAEAQREIQRARQLAPDDLIVVNNVGKLHYLQHAFAQAVEDHKFALELDPDFRKAHRDLGLAYAELGELDEALHEIQLAQGLTIDARDVLSAEAYAYARCGQTEEARGRLSELEKLAQGKSMAYEIAAIYAALGEKDQAFHWLRRAWDQHSAARAGVRIDPRLDDLRGDPRLEPFLRESAPTRSTPAAPGKK